MSRKDKNTVGLLRDKYMHHVSESQGDMSLYSEKKKKEKKSEGGSLTKKDKKQSRLQKDIADENDWNDWDDNDWGDWDENDWSEGGGEKKKKKKKDSSDKKKKKKEKKKKSSSSEEDSGGSSSGESSRSKKKKKKKLDKAAGSHDWDENDWNGNTKRKSSANSDSSPGPKKPNRTTSRGNAEPSSGIMFESNRFQGSNATGATSSANEWGLSTNNPEEYQRARAYFEQIEGKSWNLDLSANPVNPKFGKTLDPNKKPSTSHLGVKGGGSKLGIAKGGTYLDDDEVRRAGHNYEDQPLVAQTNFATRESANVDNSQYTLDYVNPHLVQAMEDKYDRQENEKKRGGFHAAGDYEKDLQLFQSVVPMAEAKFRLRTTNEKQTWRYYELGGEDDVMQNLDPVIFVPGETCGAEAYFYELDALSAKGYKCIVCHYPPVADSDDWADGFSLFLDHLNARQVHIFGNGLGGYLAQAYAAKSPRRIASLMLCNCYRQPPTYSYFQTASMIQMMPLSLLHTMILPNKEADEDYEDCVHPKIKEAADWLHGRLKDGKSLDYDDLCARTVLMYTSEEVKPLSISKKKILIIESNDISGEPVEYMEDLKRTYRSGKIAQLKQGGDYPFLCDVTGLNVYLEVHLRNNGYFDRLMDDDSD